jgi:phosphoribosyl-ATP pyrophosphohydrolase
MQKMKKQTQKEHSYLVKDKTSDEQYITNKVGSKGLIVSIIDHDLTYVTAALASSTNMDVTTIAPNVNQSDTKEKKTFKTKFSRKNHEQSGGSHKLFLLTNTSADNINTELQDPDFLNLAQTNNVVCYICEYKAPKKKGDIQIKVIPTKK